MLHTSHSRAHPAQARRREVWRIWEFEFFVECHCSSNFVKHLCEEHFFSNFSFSSLKRERDTGQPSLIECEGEVLEIFKEIVEKKTRNVNRRFRTLSICKHLCEEYFFQILLCIIVSQLIFLRRELDLTSITEGVKNE